MKAGAGGELRRPRHVQGPIRQPPPPLTSDRSLCILGAGAAGLAAAHALRDTDVRVTVLEKSRGLGGRAATRWRDHGGTRWRFDHGAQYVSPDPESRVGRLLAEALDADGLVPIEGAVWPFSNDGTVEPGRATTDGVRWTYRDGISDLGRRLAAATPGLDVRRQTRAVALQHGADGWRVETDGGPTLGPFDAVLVTAPAPQAAEVVGASRFDDAVRQPLADTLAAATYRAQFTVVLAFEGASPRPAPYALVNAPASGRPEHDVAWLAVESDKPGRAPAGATLLLAQMSAGWTQAHYDDAQSDVVAAATEAVASLLGPLPAPAWTDTQRWRYALPDGRVDAAALAAAAALGLFVAGDATAEKGRVHLALDEGLQAADRIAAWRRTP